MRVKNNLILDNEGRSLVLRGVNLGGDSKIPYCIPGKETNLDFLDRKNDVSFAGRPFPVEEAGEHFKRLKDGGFTFLRFIVTWEAIEHEGPGIYDEAYLAYLRKILLAAEKEGISVFIDPHQDVWSRWTGGDGAPAWTMEKLGMDLALMDSTGAAVTRQRYELHHDGKPYPKMLWPSNYNRYAAATMFSLFFAGAVYAPDIKIDGENIQDWLQNKYIAAFRHTQRRLKNCAAIKGWGVMNEPSDGFIGLQNLAEPERFLLPEGPRPSPWETMMAASGFPVKVPVYSNLGFNISRYEIFNPEGKSLFKEGYTCPWKQAGVWEQNGGEPKLIKSDHFGRLGARPAIFADDFLRPFSIKYINAMKEADENNFFFIEGLPDCEKADSHPVWNKDDPQNAINAFHWYDGFSLFTKSFRSWFNVNVSARKPLLGKKQITAYFAKCLKKGIELTKEKMNNMPCLLGEFGLAFDLNNRSGFKSGDYKLHEKALSMYYDAVDANLLHSTIWNYSASNTNKYGDSW
ncbi:MAG: glycoside hydrolase family 5 protein, partial [Treponema sp.]|nr:glycoside hydrolase family 5 protein [Treponema sp.]MCL2237999.1 glycoside hydrolase family 5 protein [Treponema sp.]